ncbi:hypothetical protein [Lacipirellula limnantheis]|uniref:Uncharacterized protein n=1 Tax=Lacipirellula limnantheis TaxID=2528024 RepID=A0A517TW58_9BACT|nr:hypothetical protein [Lacipirellula limnantheis]QDT72613.1 hypothetical protein I41_17950 [Lacipirellula limnantheis]
MDGAALLALLAAVGFGWQPMPDGSERYEYIVQVDQDLAATLAAGKSIPIVGEVPEGIHPIGRVRIMVGSGDLPRERLVTRLKPVVVAAAGESSREASIVVRGQNAVAPAQYNQYATPLVQQPPASQPLADAASAAASAWNGGGASAPAPSSSQLFDSATSAAQQAWNDNVAAPAANAMNAAGQNLSNQVNSSLQQGIDSASAQAQQTWNNASQNLQGAASSLGDRTKSLVNEVAQPLSPQPAQTARGLRQQQPASPMAAVPPPSTGAAAVPPAYGSTTPPPSTWNQPTPPATNSSRSGVDPSMASSSPTAANEWNNASVNGFPTGAPLAQPTLGNSGVPGSPLQQSAPQPMASSAAAMNDWNSSAASTPPAPVAGQPAAAASGGFGGNDPWQGVPDPRTPATSAASPGGSVAGSPATPYRGAGATVFPATPPLNAGALGAATPNSSPPNAATPSIDSRMLTQAADRPLDSLTVPVGLGGVPATSASSAPSAPPAAPHNIFATNPQNPASTPAATNQPAANPPSANAAGAGNAANAAGAAASGKDNAVVTLVAWVLLFGSAFGNLYLFWSYLDVRQKYRSLVRKTARAVGSRFSTA